jgi:hypothetical protein
MIQHIDQLTMTNDFDDLWFLIDSRFMAILIKFSINGGLE